MVVAGFEPGIHGLRNESVYRQQDDQGKFADLVPVILSSLFL